MDIERTFDAMGVREIEVKLAVGDVRMVGAEEGQIRLKARIRSNNAAELRAGLVDDVLVIGNGDPDWSGESLEWSGRLGRIDVELAVPASLDAPVRVRSGKGDVSVDSVRGLRHVHTGKGDVSLSGGDSDLEVHSGMGDVAVRGWDGNLAIQTGKGDVAASDVAGALSVHTGAGDIAIRHWETRQDEVPNGRCTVETGSGDIAISDAQAPALNIRTGRGDCTLSHASLATLKVRSGSGDVALDGQPAAGRWDVHTGQGDIRLRVPASAAVRVEAATRHGDISSDLPQVKVGRPGPVSQHGGRRIGILGNEPRAEILLETGKGDISIRTSGAPATTVVVEPPERPAVEVVRVPELQTTAVTPVASRDTALTILESLSRGEISVDEAATLLRSLEPA